MTQCCRSTDSPPYVEPVHLSSDFQVRGKHLAGYLLGVMQVSPAVKVCRMIQEHITYKSARKTMKRIFFSAILITTVWLSMASESNARDAFSDLRNQLGEEIWNAPNKNKASCGDNITQFGLLKGGLHKSAGAVVGVDQQGNIHCEIVTYSYSDGSLIKDPLPVYLSRIGGSFNSPYVNCELRSSVCAMVLNGDKVIPEGVALVVNRVLGQKGATPQPSSPQPIARLPQGSGRIKSSGTAFAVGNDGTLATNFHVVDGCNGLRAKVGRELRKVEVAAIDPGNDLAVVQIEQTRTKGLPLSTRKLELGSKITVLGFPLTSVLGTDLRVTTGIVSSLGGIGDDRRAIQISAAVQPGNSGGPVLDEFNEVVGVTVAKLAKQFSGENVNFAIRAPLLRSLLEINGISYISQQVNKHHSTEEIANKSGDSTYLLFCYQ